MGIPTAIIDPKLTLATGRLMFRNGWRAPSHDAVSGGAGRAN